MTFDIIGLCREEPGPATVVPALAAAGGELRADIRDEPPLIRLLHPDGRLLTTVEDVHLVRVEGEARRLLGIGEDVEVPHPVWWVEVWAPGDDPEAETAARAFTTALVAGTGGLSWSNR
ncbi:hypothetical protein [Amycolatopsis alba]|uniref:Uncharacterized protein n=1 Tax=Amycolatopsis alba DSM 44262 TaxID=1125972 RepID=A0A229RG36_AMYAL|nr:hypothetical protein [Amycolatopsis alba]OXM45633.1 hypothetical protein CFP75_30355 [Amycolatopsis alba DSM 44262]